MIHSAIARSVFRLGLIVGVLLSGAISAAAQESSALETLPPSSALSEVQASGGVVFVDLYAEW